MARYIEKISHSALDVYFKENSFNEYKTIRIIPLRIYSPTAAVFLNRALNHKLECRSPYARSASWRTYGDADLKGGGLFGEALAHIGIDELNQVYVIFKRPHDVVSYCRSGSTMAYFTSSVKDKLANALKDFYKWGYERRYDEIPKKKEIRAEYLETLATKYYDIYDCNSHVFHLIANFNYEITLEEYRCLYETLKGRNPEKIKTKYGADLYDRIIGHEIEDQFVLSAIDVIKTEINEVIAHANIEKEKLENYYSELYNEMMKKKKTEINAVQQLCDNKVKELSEQIAGLMANSLGFKIAE